MRLVCEVDARETFDDLRGHIVPKPTKLTKNAHPVVLSCTVILRIGIDRSVWVPLSTPYSWERAAPQKWLPYIRVVLRTCCHVHTPHYFVRLLCQCSVACPIDLYCRSSACRRFDEYQNTEYSVVVYESPCLSTYTSTEYTCSRTTVCSKEMMGCALFRTSCHRYS